MDYLLIILGLLTIGLIGKYIIQPIINNTPYIIKKIWYWIKTIIHINYILGSIIDRLDKLEEKDK